MRPNTHQALTLGYCRTPMRPPVPAHLPPLPAISAPCCSCLISAWVTDTVCTGTFIIKVGDVSCCVTLSHWTYQLDVNCVGACVGACVCTCTSVTCRTLTAGRVLSVAPCSQHQGVHTLLLVFLFVSFFNDNEFKSTCMRTCSVRLDTCMSTYASGY